MNPEIDSMDPIATVLHTVESSLDVSEQAFGLSGVGADALERVGALVEMARQERVWPAPLSGILSAILAAMDVDAPLHAQDAPFELAPTPADEPPPSPALAPTSPVAQVASLPSSPPSRANADIDRTAELLLAAIGSRPLDGPGRAIVARLLTGAIANEDWGEARRALEILVTGG